MSVVDRFFDSIRSDEARDGEAMAVGFDHLRGHKYALFVSYRRSGEPVPTPVWFGLDPEGRAFFRTDTRTAKVRRLRANPAVKLAPCTLRGKPVGEFAPGTARVLPDSAEAHAEEALQANYGVGRKLYQGTAGSDQACYVEVTAA
jgi:uncharacterized protein